MFQKMTKATANIVIIAIVFGILILINILASDMHSRWDLTEDKIYTLSDTTRDVVANLPDQLIVTLYSSSDLPTQVREMRKKVIDVIEEYKVYANSNFIFREEHPAIDDEDEEQRLADKGIMKKRLGGQLAAGAEMTEVGIGYLDLEITYGGESEPIIGLGDIDSLEYRITHTIFKLTAKEMPVIGIYAGAGIKATSQEGGYYALGLLIDDQYSKTSPFGAQQDPNSPRPDTHVMEVDLSTGAPVPEEVTTMVMISPESFGDPAKFALDQFIMRGGKVIFLLDAVDTSMQQGPRGKRKPMPWSDFLNHYGLKVDNSLAVDLAGNATLPMSPYRYPLWHRIIKDGFGDLGFTSNLESVALDYVSPVEYTGAQSDGEVEVSTIFHTSEEAFTLKEPYDLTPDRFLQKDYERPSELGVLDLGIMLSGSFKSYFADKDIPAVQNREGIPEKVSGDDDLIPVSKVPTELILIGGSKMFSDEKMIQRSFQGNVINSENMMFLQNMFDALGLGKGLIELRSRQVTDRSLKGKDDLAESDIAFMKFSGIYLIPILLSIIGIGRYFLRVQTKKMIEAKMMGGD